jgi:hypothetical protein
MMDVTRLPAAACFDDLKARYLPGTTHSLLVHSDGIANHYPFGRAKADNPHCAQAWWRTPLKLGRRPCHPCLCRRTASIDKWVARSREAGVGFPSVSCFTGGTITTITNSRLLHCDTFPVLESQTTAPSVRALDRRGLGNPPCGDISHSTAFYGYADATSGVSMAVSLCLSRTAHLPRSIPARFWTFKNLHASVDLHAIL